MSNEIAFDSTATGSTLYAVIESMTDLSIWSVDLSAMTSMVVLNWVDYAIALTETPAGSYRYIGDSPTGLPAGIYRVKVYVQSGGSPAITDKKVGEGELVWSGSLERTMRDLVDEALGTWELDPVAKTLTMRRSDGTTLSTFTLTDTAAAVPAFIGRTPT